MRFTAHLPWPPRQLSPNARLHWRAVAKHKRDYRTECWTDALQWGVKRIKADKVNVDIEFRLPDRRKRDDDNIIASFKAGRDGVADALGVDDANWLTTYRISPKVEGQLAGCVIVTITTDEPAPDVVTLENRGTIS